MDTSKPAFPNPVPDDVLNKQGNSVVTYAGLSVKQFYQSHILTGIVHLACDRETDLVPDQVKRICELTEIIADEMCRRDNGKAN